MPKFRLHKLYKIPPHHAINVQTTPGGPPILLRGPAFLEGDKLPIAMVQGYVESGFLVPAGEPVLQPEDHDDIRGAIVGNDSVRPPEGAAATVPITSRADAEMKPEKAIKHRTPWMEDPGRMRKKSLEQLNLMIRERAPDMTPFDTVDEAAAWLSQDFGR